MNNAGAPVLAPRPGEIRREAEEAIHDTGYIAGRGTERDFRERLRLRTGIAGTDAALAASLEDGM